MPFPCLSRPLRVLASALAAAGLVLAAGGCGHVTPLGQDPPPASFPPARDLSSPIMMQIMRSQPPTSAGQCPASSVALFGLDPHVPRAAVSQSLSPQPAGSTATPAPTPTPATPPAGVACFRPVGSPVKITKAAVSPVTAQRTQPGPAWYVFAVAFPAADVAALTALIQRAYAAGDAVGMSVAGQLWQAPQTRHEMTAFRGEQVNLLSRNQAVRLHRLLVPSG